VLVRNDFASCRGTRIGILANQCSFDSQGTHLVEHVLARDLRLEALFAPEHGLWSTHQDMEPVEGSTDPLFGLPVKSLYGRDVESLAPDRACLSGLDLLIVDLQDIGARYYTFAATMAKAMRAASGMGIRFLVLDRPNPINGLDVEGGLLRPELCSYVGELDVPQRHALTMGELARMTVAAEKLDVELEVLPMEGWRREWYFEETGAAWIPPSPNMPAVSTALVYPGLCLLEGTNVSEGRGSTTPFELFGAPWVKARELAGKLAEEGVCEGAVLFAVCFRPQFGKWAGQVCTGLRLNVADRGRFRPLAFGIALIKWLFLLHPGQFDWRRQTYEFVSDRLAIDLLLGDPEVRARLEAGEPVGPVVADLDRAAAPFAEARREWLLYPA
jgi:uncharacterized protein YbbC (DUF1343 family)